MVERITVDADNGDILEVVLGSFIAYESVQWESAFVPWEDVPSKLDEVRQWEIWNGHLLSYDRLVELIGDYEKSIH